MLSNTEAKKWTGVNAIARPDSRPDAVVEVAAWTESVVWRD
jgi:hypothetical protein